MLTFFRRLRKSLLVSGAVRNYILYATGEILLVMVGILLALQVNNWNQDRGIQKQIKLNLKNLSEAINKDYEILNAIETNNGFRYYSLLQVLKLAEISKDEIDTSILLKDSTYIWIGPFPDTFDWKFIDITFKWINRPRVMTMHLYALEEFKNTGLYSHLNNQGLKDQLSEYYARLD